MRSLLLLVALLLVGVGALFWVLAGESDGSDRDIVSRSSAVAPGRDDGEPDRDRPTRVTPPPAAEVSTAPREARTAVDVVPSVRVEPRAEAAPPSAPARVTGMVISEHGPVPNAFIEVVSANDELLGRGESAENGRFLVQLRPIEGASVRVVGYGYAPMELYVRRLGAGELKEIGNVRLQKGLPIRGKVVGPRGVAIADADVSVRSAMGNAPSNRALLSTRSGPDGRFLLRDAPAGRVRVVAMKEGHGERGVETSAARTDEELVIELTPATSLVVRVTDRRGHRLANAEVRISCRDRASPNREGLTDDEGVCRFDGLGAPKWDVRVLAHGYRPASIGDVDADGREVPISVDPWPCLEGTIVAPGGKAPPSGTRVVALPALSGVQRSSDASLGEPVDSNGNFRLCDLRPGDYVVVAEAPGFAPSRSSPVRVSLERDGAAGTLHLVPGGTLELTIAGTGGRVAGATVDLHANAPPRAALWHPTALLPAVESGTSDANGRVTFDHLEPGGLWALVRSEEHLPQIAGPFQVLNGRDARPDAIQLEEGARIAGVVTDETGQVVASAVVVVTGPNLGSAVQMTADANGRFRSPPLPSGAYEARARGTSSRNRQALSEPQPIEVKVGQSYELQLTL